MSDNIAPDLIEQELDARLRIPNEVWTDVMKLLPRRFLIKRIAPVCFRFKEISDKNVKNVHVITKANWFSYKLKKNDPIAKKQLEHLAANDCQLSGQFRLKEIRIIEENKVIVSHCPDLFKGSQIRLYFNKKNKNSALFLDCLSLLDKAKPVKILISQSVNQVVDFWHHLTFQHCTRVHLDFWPSLSAATVKTSSHQNVFDWLHHQPNGMDCDGTAADQQVRGMIVWFEIETNNNHIDWLIKCSTENIQQSQRQIDRRPYVLSFCLWDEDWPGFGQFRRIENKSTGEVLMLNRVMAASGHPTNWYRLRRCLAAEEANAKEFYAKMFDRAGGFEKFRIDEKTPEVIVG